MTDSIEERTAARERELLEAMDGQRRLARPEDYVFDKREAKFWDLADGTLHDAISVDASIPQELWRVVVEEAPEGDAPRRGRPRARERLVKPTIDIMRVENDQFVEGSTWWPGRPQIIRDWFVDSDSAYESPGRRIYNVYKPPPEIEGDAGKAGPWIEHVKKLYPNEIEHEFIFNFCAHMVQRPHEKCNAGVILSGAQRIGKDAILYAMKTIVGSWNTKDIDPDAFFASNSQPWVQTLMLTVNEARPSKDEFHASALYNMMKPMLATPPMVLPRPEKFEKLRYVMNVMRVFVTTNDWMAMYIPPGDGRLFIAHSTIGEQWYLKEEATKDYFVKLYGWMDAGGSGHVGAWLRARDLREFNPKGEVPKTVGWEAVTTSWEAAEDCVAQALETMEHPAVLFGTELVAVQFDGADEMQALLKKPRALAHRMQKSGYILVKPDGERWQYVVGAGKFRSRTAFVRPASGISPEGYRKAIDARGRAMAEKMAAGLRVGQKEGF